MIRKEARSAVKEKVGEGKAAGASLEKEPDGRLRDGDDLWRLAWESGGRLATPPAVAVISRISNCRPSSLADSVPFELLSPESALDCSGQRLSPSQRLSG